MHGYVFNSKLLLKRSKFQYLNKEWRLYFQCLFVASILVPEPEMTHNKCSKITGTLEVYNEDVMAFHAGRGFMRSVRPL